MCGLDRLSELHRRPTSFLIFRFHRTGIPIPVREARLIAYFESCSCSAVFRDPQSTEARYAVSGGALCRAGVGVFSPKAIPGQGTISILCEVRAKSFALAHDQAIACANEFLAARAIRAFSKPHGLTSTPRGQRIRSANPITR